MSSIIVELSAERAVLIIRKQNSKSKGRRGAVCFYQIIIGRGYIVPRAVLVQFALKLVEDVVMMTHHLHSYRVATSGIVSGLQTNLKGQRGGVQPLRPIAEIHVVIAKILGLNLPLLR